MEISLPSPPSQPSFKVSTSIYPRVGGRRRERGEERTLGADETPGFPTYDIKLSQICQREKEENGPNFRRMYIKPTLQAEYPSKEPTAVCLRQARCEVYSFVLGPMPVLAVGAP